MDQKLPDGLIQSGTPYTSSDEDDDRLSMDDVIRLWRAHFALKSAQPSGIGFRLEYFFWRIMGSSRLQQILTESQIARVHAMISQDNPIRTTPQQTPIRFGTNNDIPDSSGVNASLSSDGRFMGRRNLDASTAKAHASRDRSTSRPPRPILRTPGIDTITPGKSARILTPTWGGNNGKEKGKPPLNQEIFDGRDNSLKLQSPTSPTSPNTGPTPNTSNLSTVQSMASPKPALEGSPSKAGRKSSFAVGSKRRRPAMPHRRSSQSAASSSMNARSPKQSPGINQGSLEATRSISDGPSGLQQISETSSRSETTGNNNNNSISVTPSLRTGSSQYRSEGDLKLAAATNLNPPMRAISKKATLSTGVSLVTPVTASLQPFALADQAASSSSAGAGRSPVGGTASESQTFNTRDTPHQPDTLQRSRDNLHLLLQKDRRRASKKS